MTLRVLHPAEEPLRLDALATVLDGARMLAQRSFHPDRYDIYHCAQRSWRATNQPVPFAAVTYQLRRLVEGGQLLAYNDTPGRTRTEVAALFADARDHVLNQHRQHRPTAPAPAAAPSPLATVLAATA